MKKCYFQEIGKFHNPFIYYVLVSVLPRGTRKYLKIVTGENTKNTFSPVNIDYSLISIKKVSYFTHEV